MEFVDLEKAAYKEVYEGKQCDLFLQPWERGIYDALHCLTWQFKHEEVTKEAAGILKQGWKERHSELEKVVSTMTKIGEIMAEMEVATTFIDKLDADLVFGVLAGLAADLSHMGYKDSAIAIVEDLEKNYQEKWKDLTAN